MRTLLLTHESTTSHRSFLSLECLQEGVLGDEDGLYRYVKYVCANGDGDRAATHRALVQPCCPRRRMLGLALQSHPRGYYYYNGRFPFFRYDMLVSIYDHQKNLQYRVPEI
jgi:hypothetical protein